MSVEADIILALKGLVGGRAYPDAAPAGVAKPYLVYQQVGGVALSFLERQFVPTKNGRFQVSAWADTRIAAAALADQIEAAMVQSTAFQASPTGAAIATFDEETQLRGTTQDFSVWSTR